MEIAGIHISVNAEVVIFKGIDGRWLGYVVANRLAWVIAEGSAPNHVWRKAHFKGFHNFRYLSC